MKGTEMHFLIEGEMPCLNKRNDKRNQESDHYGHDIESHLPFFMGDVFEIDAAAEIEYQKDKDRDEC